MKRDFSFTQVLTMAVLPGAWKKGCHFLSCTLNQLFGGYKIRFGHLMVLMVRGDLHSEKIRDVKRNQPMGPVLWVQYNIHWVMRLAKSLFRVKPLYFTVRIRLYDDRSSVYVFYKSALHRYMKRGHWNSITNVAFKEVD